MTWTPDPAAFVRDLEAKPVALRELASLLAEDPWREVERGDRVVFTGVGSSRFAALPIAAMLRAAGRDAVAERSSAASVVPAGPGTLAIGISASGSTPEPSRRWRVTGKQARRRSRSRTRAHRRSSPPPITTSRYTPARKRAGSPVAPSSTRSRCCSRPRCTSRSRRCPACRRRDRGPPRPSSDMAAGRGRHARRRTGLLHRARGTDQLRRTGRADVS